MTLTIAGSKQLMAERSASPRGNELKTTNNNANLMNSVPIFPPGYVPKLLVPSPAASAVTSAAAAQNIATIGASSSSSDQSRGNNIVDGEPRCGMSAAAIALRSTSSNSTSFVNTGSHSIGTKGCINSSMNIVSDTPEPYLEPIKLLNKQSSEEGKQSPSAARSFVGGVPGAERSVSAALRQVNKSCFTGTKFPSASSRPIPPPKVLLKRQESARVSGQAPPRNLLSRRQRHRAEEKVVEVSPTTAKKRELAYLIVDLESGRTAIGTKNNRALDDSDVGLKSLKLSSEEKPHKFPVRSFTMSVPGDQIKRPVVKPRATRNISQDSVKELCAQSENGSGINHQTTSSHSSRSKSPSLGTSVTMETTGPLDTHQEHPEIFISSQGEEKELVNGLAEHNDDAHHPPAAAAASAPPLPPKRSLVKAPSLPHNGLPAMSRLLRDGRTSLPASSLTTDIQNVNRKVERHEHVPSPVAGDSSNVCRKPAKSRVPPPKPKPYSERVVTPPPPPCFPPPPRPTTSSNNLSALQGTSPPPLKRASSPVPPPKVLSTPSPPPPSSLAKQPLNSGMKSSHSHQSLLPPRTCSVNQLSSSSQVTCRNRLHSESKLNKPKPPKPPPPYHPPPVNSKITKLISEHRSRTQSSGGGAGTKGQGSSSSVASIVKPLISEPRLISTTMKSDSRSLTDLRSSQERDITEEPEEEDDDLIPCSNISYISTSELFPPKQEEDRPVPLYEDIDSVIPLPPLRTDLLNKPSVPNTRKLSADSAPPELPPKPTHPDPLGRRRRRRKSPPILPPKTHLSKALSVGSSETDRVSLSPDLTAANKDDAVEPYYVKKIMSEEAGNSDEGNGNVVQDTGTYEPIRSPSLVNGDDMEEPDVGGVDEYVMMGSVISRAWEKEENNKAMEEDLPDDSYVEMQPVAVSSSSTPSPSSQDVSRNFYELDDDDEPEPVYIEMNPQEFIPPKQLHYASKDLLTDRPDLQAKKKKKSGKRLFYIGGRK